MVQISLVDRAGGSHTIEGKADRSLMEVIREAGFDELMALCGGGCACATCHVYLDDATFSRLPARSEDENDLLDTSENRRANSRLACQVKVDAALAGATVSIVAE